MGGLCHEVTDAFGLVLLLVIATYVLASLTRYSGWGAVGITTLGCSRAAVAFGSARVGARGVRIGVAVALVAIALAAAATLSGDADLLGASAEIQTLLLIAATASILRTVLGHTEVSFRTILGAISVYMIFGLLFTSLYVAIDRLQAGAFFAEGRGSQTGDFIFFSFYDADDDRIRKPRASGAARIAACRIGDAFGADLPGHPDRGAGQPLATQVTEERPPGACLRSQRTD